MRWIRIVTACVFALLVVAPVPAADDKPIEYPQTRRGDQVDVYHGTKVADPYRWLEEDVRKSQTVADWVAAENKVTFAYLEAIPERERIRRRLTELWDYARYSSPLKEGGRYYYHKNDGLQNQAVLYTMDSLDDKARVLIDPNQWSKDGTIALSGTAFSEDGKYVAYRVSEAGSDWAAWRVMEIASGKILEDELRWIKFGGASWAKDGRGFFYSRYPQPEAGAAFSQLNFNQKIYFHRLGTPQSEDVLVYCRPDHPDWGFSPEVTEDGRYLIITTGKGTDEKYRISYKDLSEPYGMPLDLIDNFEHEYTFAGNDGQVFFFQTDLDAPRKRVIAIELRRPQQENWRQIIPQAEETLQQVRFVGNLLVASYLKDVKPQVKMFTTSGEFVREVGFPAIGAVAGFEGHRTDTETFYSFSSCATPPSIYRYDLITGQSRLLRRAKVKFNPEDYQVEQVFYHSKDGTRVPMFLAHRKGLKRDGSNPTLLYGYGGFAVPVEPTFSITALTWMDLGGIWATANLRGGGEYGQQWHQAGALANKQNVFDDFIAAAEWLIQEKYTRRDKLAILGRSNGGLLVGAVMTQRPDLCGACLPAVGVMDMLRFQKFTAGRFWVDDYGSSDDPQQFKTLLAYSPYHNIKPGTHYPATLITTADTDDRVVPGHSFKFAAALQHAQAHPQAGTRAPVLIRIETRAGHGGGKPTTKQIEELADQWAFLVKNLGMKLP
jgi:prolyl oligopeptidase